MRLSHKKQLEGRELEPDTRITRLVPRYEDAFRRANLSFSREGVARVFVRVLAQDADAALPRAERSHFERLFAMIRDCFEDLRG